MDRAPSFSGIFSPPLFLSKQILSSPLVCPSLPHLPPLSVFLLSFQPSIPPLFLPNFFGRGSGAARASGSGGARSGLGWVPLRARASGKCGRADRAGAARPGAPSAVVIVQTERRG